MTLNELLELKYTDAEKYELALDEYYSSKGICINCGYEFTKTELEIHDRYDNGDEIYICNKCNHKKEII